MSLISLSIDELTKVVKGTGPDAFKSVALAYARTRWGRHVEYTDGTGDGGVDAWIILSSDPEVRYAAQFHAGAETWRGKLEDDLKKMAAYRDSLSNDNPKRAHFQRCHFICTASVAHASADRFADELFQQFQIRVDIHDAGIIAGCARDGTELWRLLARRIGASEPLHVHPWDAREEALLAFSFFGHGANRFRREVAKSAVLTVLHRNNGARSKQALLTEAAELLHVSTPARLVQHAIRDLERNGSLSQDSQELVTASTEALENLRVAINLASRSKTALRTRCVQLLEPSVPTGTHHRNLVAERSADVVMERLGLLVRTPIADEVLYSVRPEDLPRTRQERTAVREWQATIERLNTTLHLETGTTHVLRDLVQAIANDAFVQRLAAAELFFSLTEHDEPEFEKALSASHKRILMDASIAMPMLCARMDVPIAEWSTSVAANELFHCAHLRSAELQVASVHLEEMASHLYGAREFAALFNQEAGDDLKRSRNFYVAHFASSPTWEKSQNDFMEYLNDFGLSHARRDTEKQLRSLLKKQGIRVVDTEDIDVETPLNDEPERDERLLRHDRAVVRSLEVWTEHDPWLMCSADSWLLKSVNERNILAFDSVGLTDLLSLMHPTGFARPLLSPLNLAFSLDETNLQAAAVVWDEIVRIEGPKLTNQHLYREARRFRDTWLAEKHNSTNELAQAWKRFRDANMAGTSA